MTGMNRLPASFFVSVSYMCWAYRRRRMIVRGDDVAYQSEAEDSMRNLTPSHQR